MGATTPNKALIQPTVGSDDNSWGSELNTSLGDLDTITGGTVSVNCAGMIDVTLTTPQAQNLIIRPTGILTGNINLLFPQPGFYLIDNTCTGAFALTAKNTAGGTGVVAPQGTPVWVATDGTTVWQPNISTPVSGTYWCAASTGSANQQLLTPVSASLSALTAGDTFSSVAGFTNTSSMQVGVSGTGGFQTALRRTSGGLMPFVGGEVFLGNAYLWLWDGSQFQLMNQAP